MSKELVIGSNRHETKVAILEDDQLVEIYFQRANEYSLAGSIHKGKVTRVLPGMQSAFVDLGLERDTFLYVSDFFDEHEDIDTVADEPRAPRSEKRDRGEQRFDRGPNRQGGEREGGNRRRNEFQSASPAASATGEGLDLLPTGRQETEAGSLPAELESGREESLEEDDLEIGDQLAGPVQAEAREGEASSASPSEERSDNRGHGDRRHRRSRRRRNRGRSFPENKYAQPGESPVAATAAHAPGVRPTPAVEEESQLPAGDVLVLPGESLRKYRNAPAVASSPSEPRESSETYEPPRTDDRPMTNDRFPTESVEPATEHGEIEEEAIAEEAEEIQLADRVFAGNPADEVKPKHDEVSPAKDDASTRDVSALPVDRRSQPTASERLADEPTFAASFEPEATVQSAVLLENAQPLTTFEANNPFASRLEEEELASPPIESEVLEERIEIAELAEELESRLDETEPGSEDHPQTAVLRESTDTRQLQRPSRRMRRRRGGNRFASGGGSDAQPQVDPALPATFSNGSGAAAAPAPEKAERTVERADRALPSISDLLKSGQEIIVQIAKEPLGQKGARITSHVALPGRYVVFMPSVNHLGVSRKIASDEERQRLKKILQAHRATGASGGFIVRTAGEGVPEAEIASDMNFLYNQWLDIRQKAEKKPAPALLHYDLDIVQRILRDQVTEDYKAIWVDSSEMYENVLTFMQRFQPALVNRVKMYTRSAPIFDAFNITQELEKALRPKVWLKSGGYIVINQTEALVAIDINTGKYVGKSNRLEDTIVKTNTEAVKEIVRQIRLRDLGGIIVVDFIDMDERKNRQKVMQALEEAMRADKAPYKILQFNDFGLVAITRKRVKQSLERTLCSPCPYCEAAGYVKSVQTVISEILIEAQKIAKAIDTKDVLLRVHPDVAKTLKASSNKYLEDLEDILGRPVLVKGDQALHIEKFDLA